MNQSLEATKGRNYKKIMKKYVLGAAIAFPLVYVIGYSLNFMIYSILLYLTVVVSIGGYIGGIWLWEYLATSELIKGDMKRTIKLVGTIALIGFIAFISFNIYIAFYGDFAFLQMIVTNANYVLLFMFCYFVGYLLSIWHPSEPSESDTASESMFKLDWNAIKKVLKIAIPICAITTGIILVIGIIQGQIMEYLIYCGIALLLIFGFFLGYLVWEHLKESELITGEFQAQLKWISVAATIVLGGLTAYGFWVVTLASFQLYQELILYYSVFLICMFFYFLGLYVSVIRSE